MLDILLAALGALALALGLASRPLRSLPLTEPLAALILGVVLGPAVLGLIDLSGPHEVRVLEVASRLVLAFSVMGVALRYAIDEIIPFVRGLVLLLTVVLLGMTALTAGLAAWILAMPWGAALLVGAILAPTDPVLASSIVTGEPASRDLPKRTRVLISIESAANDGLTAPLVILATIFVMGGSLARGSAGVAYGVAVALVLGGVMGWLVGRLVVASERHRDLEHSAFLVLTLALAVLVLGTVETAGGIGVLGVFVAGLFYNAEIERIERREEWEVQEAINRYLILPVFTLLGLALPWEAWLALGWTGVGFTAGVLLLRRIPLVLAGAPLLGVRVGEAAFIGWFGPIGAAALLYLAEAHGTGALDRTGWAVGTLVIAVSTVVHGVTAAPGRWAFRAGRRREAEGAARGK